MTDLFKEPSDATPLDPELRHHLIPGWVATRKDLNEVEQENIVKGMAWSRRARIRVDNLLTETFSAKLHKQMFGKVWKWAGDYRRTSLNIGIAPHLVPLQMPAMFDDVRFWVANNTYSPDEIAVRLHHRLTQIHGFPNGNGRHARLMADLLVEKLGGKPFTWGSGSIHDTGTLREAYITALKSADNHDIGPLLKFARS
jgi:Fic-DOC domain mobile mystery protein B